MHLCSEGLVKRAPYLGMWVLLLVLPWVSWEAKYFTIYCWAVQGMNMLRCSEVGRTGDYASGADTEKHKAQSKS